jgi:peptidoglycan/xylan/chitin deacetylase (PgdA/CDA1 family)
MKFNKKNLKVGAVLLVLVLGFFLLIGDKFTRNSKPQTIKHAAQNVLPELNPINKATADAPKTPTSLGQTISVSRTIRVPVLMYHRIGVPPDPASSDLTVSVSDFEGQIKYFKSLGYESVSLQQVYTALTQGTKLVSKPIVFTFDDGYKDAFDNAVPILLKYGYTGSFAIATELLGRPTYAVWDDVIAAHKAHMEIVSHTENHLDLRNPVYSESDLHREIFDSKNILEAKLGVPVDFFVYPYGRYDEKVLDLVKQAGYKMAFTTAYGTELSYDRLLVEPRVRVHGQNGLEKLKNIFSPQIKHTGSVQTNP